MRKAYVRRCPHSSRVPPSSGEAKAQTYPSRPITMVVALPGRAGPTDTLARIVAEPMRAGAGSAHRDRECFGCRRRPPALPALARSAPDGYALIFGHLATHVILPGDAIGSATTW